MPDGAGDLLRIGICAAGILAGWWAFGRPRRIPRADPGQPAGRGPDPVTVVIPARDEALSIGGLLEDLAELPTGVHVVVVDDHSTDATAAIVRDHDGVELVTAPDLPRGWTGKSWACHVGASEATDGTLVFVDADVRLSAGALGAVLAEHDRCGGLVSVQPWHDVVRPYERLSAMFNVVALMGAGAGARRPIAAFGPVLVTSVADYRLVGGHESVRDAITEDMALGHRYAAEGLTTTVISCDERVRYRMYPAGFRQLVDGWTKNYATGARAVPRVRLLATVLWITFLGSASVAALEALAGRGRVVSGVLLYGCAVAQTWALFRRAGRFGFGTAAFLPVHLAMFVGVFLRSLWRTWIRRSVVWRGRAVRIAPAASDADLGG